MMIPKIRNILYASDLSDNTIPALAWAMMLSHQHDAKITFLHVNEKVSSHTTSAIRSFMGEDQWKKMTDNWKDDADSEIKDRIHKFCETAASGMEACPVAVQNIVVTRGVPVESIIRESERHNSDVIVMGTHGAGLFKGAVIGSTARRVVRLSKVPVFVVPLKNNEE